MSRYSDSSCKVYVGDLPTNVQRADLEDVFSRYGYLRSVWVARNPPGFAFVEFDDSRDARDAVAELDGKRCSEIGGKSLKVELSSGRRRGGGRFGGGGGRDGGGRDGGYGGGGRRPSFGGDRRQESCYACGARGHFARDCRFGRKPGDGTRSSRRRSRSRSRSRSPRSRSPRSRSPRSRSRSRSPKRHSRRSPTRSRSPSPKD